MDWERASPGASSTNSSSTTSSSSSISKSRSEAVVGDKKNQCNKPARANDLSNNNNPTTTTGQQLVSRKNKPIPPPLDLSIGATNLSLHHHHHPPPNQSSTHSSSNLLHPPTTSGTTNTTTSHSRNSPNQQPQSWYLQAQPSPSGYIGSPKFNQSEKSLPLRKRWHSWSTVPGMNGQEDSGLLPLYSDLPTSPLAVKSEPQEQQQQQQQSQSASSSTPIGGDATNPLTAHHHNNPTLHHGSAYQFSSSAGLTPMTPTTTGYRLPYGSVMNGTGNNNGNSLGLGLSIQTPSPFYTPNEPSPKFMNSPVFSYSTPDTSLYQGPFSPMRSCLYPPSSPFTNLSLNTPGGPNSNSTLGLVQQQQSIVGGTGSQSMLNMVNMIPSTLLSPAPSQASTNSLSYEDLHEKSLNFFTPVWSIFMSNTKVRFTVNNNSQPNTSDWYSVDYLASHESILNFLKGEYAPHGLEVRKFIRPTSSKERIKVTFCPVGDPDHPSIEADCEPGHPFMVDKKGWCAIKPDVFQELFGNQCAQLDCGDVCLNGGRTGGQQQQQQQQNVPVQLNAHATSHQNLATISGTTYSALTLNGNSENNNNSSNSTVTSSYSTNLNLSTPPILSHVGGTLNNIGGNPVTLGGSNSHVKIEPGLVATEEKIIPISVLPPTNQTMMQSLQQLQQQSSSASHIINSGASLANAKMFAIPSSMPSSSSSSSGMGISPPPSAPTPSPAKRAKENQQNSSERKGRRPPNAFLLFAKDKRPELIQQYPGKDNRSISVLLGEAWANLDKPEKERYSSNARANAEEIKKNDPYCWKRKRSQSTSS